MKARKRIVGREAYLEESGELLGIVTEEVLSGEGKPLGYRIADKETATAIYIPIEQAVVTRRGIIVQPLWYVEAKRFIRKLELQESLVPGIREFSKSTKDDLIEFLTKHDPSFVSVVEETLGLKNTLQAKLEFFETQAKNVREEIIKETSIQLARGKPRKEFASKMNTLRKRIKIIEANIDKCKELTLRLESSPFLPKVVVGQVPREGVVAEKAPGAAVEQRIICPYLSKCPIISKVREKEIDIKPLRVLKMEALRTRRIPEKKIEKKVEKEEKPRGLRAKLRAREEK
jgi:hypothetical protein